MGRCRFRAKSCGSGSPKKTMFGLTRPLHVGQCGTVRAMTAECIASAGKALWQSMQLCLLRNGREVNR